MKKIIVGLSLVVSGLAAAASDVVIFPRVYNFGTYVQVQIWNTDRTNVMCSGQVYMDLQSGRRESQSVFRTVWAGQNYITNIRPVNFNDRVVSVNHSIFCR